MADKANIAKVFVGGPEDIQHHVDQVREAVERINTGVGEVLGVRLEVVTSDDVPSQSGKDAQHIINQEGLKRCDYFVGLMGHRLGSPTPRNPSGTVEEMEEALKDLGDDMGLRDVAFYFYEGTPPSLSEIDGQQLAARNQFKSSIDEVYYKDYTDPDDLGSFVHNDLTSKALMQNSS